MKVMAAGFEPATVCLEGRCSIQLSYATKCYKVGVAGFEPATSCSQSRRDDRATLHPDFLAHLTMCSKSNLFVFVYKNLMEINYFLKMKKILF